MAFPTSFLEELRSRLSVSEVVGKRLSLQRAGREFKACCPFHNEKSPSFYVNDDKNFFHCFGCGAHGDIIGFVMRHDRLSFPEAIEQLAATAGLEVPRSSPLETEKFDKEKRLYQVLERATAFFEEQLFTSRGKDALDYLTGRGLSAEAIRRFRLGFAPSDAHLLLKKLISEAFTLDELIEVGLARRSEERGDAFSFFRNRVIFPVGDRKGRTVAFGARVMGEGEPKYLNSPDHVLFHKGKLLYGLSRARQAVAAQESLIVTEGYMDVISLVEAGFIGAVAPLGTALTEDQILLLWKLLPPAEARDPTKDYSPILCFDGDGAGQRAALRSIERILPILGTGRTVNIATMPQGQDPDELIRHTGRAGMEAILRQAKPMIEMIWETTVMGRRLSTPEDRAALIAALKQRIAKIADEPLRRLYQDDIDQRVAKLFSWRSSFPKREQKSSFKGPKGNKKPWAFESREFEPRPAFVPPSVMLRLRERGFLAHMINHPRLFADFGEDFAKMPFSVQEFEALKQQVTAILAEDTAEPLDAEGLYRHLSTGEEADKGLGSGTGEHLTALLSEILSEPTYMHFGGARRERPYKDAWLSWKSIWRNMQKEHLLSLIENTRLQYAELKSDECYARLMGLRQELEHLSKDSDETEFTEHHPTSKAQEH